MPLTVWQPKHALFVMAGLVPAIHDLNTAVSKQLVDALHKAGHDGRRFGCDARRGVAIESRGAYRASAFSISGRSRSRKDSAVIGPTCLNRITPSRPTTKVSGTP